MAAPEGNQFWKLRKKHGRNKKYDTAEELWNEACEYFQWCDNHPLMKAEAVRGGALSGQIIEVPIKKTLHSARTLYFYGCKHQVFQRFNR